MNALQLARPVADRPLAMTAWPSLMSPQGQAGAISREDLLAWIRQPKIALEKASLQGFSLASFRDDRRGLDHVVFVSAVMLDDDSGRHDVEAAAAIWSAFAGAVFSTYSATREIPRTRTILFTSRDMTAAEYAIVWSHVASLATAHGVSLDAQTKDPSRLWFVPAVRPDGVFTYAELGGAEINVDAVLALAPASSLHHVKQAPTETQSYPGDVSDPEELAYRRGLYATYLRTDAPPRGPALRGQGDATLFNVVQRGAYDLALPVEDVLELVQEHYDPRCDPPWGLELEERVHHKARDAKENSTRPRAEPLPADLAELFAAVQVAPVAPASGVVLVPAKDAADKVDDLRFDRERWGGWAAPVAPVVYLLEDLIPENKVVTFYAEGGSIKSWCAFNLAISVATGEPWLGRRVQRGRALILDYEDGPHEFQRRMRILRGGILEDLPDLGYLYGGPTLDREDLWRKLARRQAIEPLTLLAIDTLGSGMPGDADENSTAFAEAVKLAGRFTEAARVHSTVPCTVVIVAHANKSGGLRGSSAIRDSSDVAFRFEPVSETDDVKRMRMVCDKPGPQRRPKPVNVELSDKGLTTFEDAPAPATPRQGEEASLQTRARHEIRLRGSFGGAIELSKLLSITRHAGRELLAELEEQGAIIRGRKRWFCGDDDEQRKRVLEVVAAQGTKALGTPALAKLAAAARPTVEDMLSERVIGRTSETASGGFFITSR